MILHEPTHRMARVNMKKEEEKGLLTRMVIESGGSFKVTLPKDVVSRLGLKDKQLLAFLIDDIVRLANPEKLDQTALKAEEAMFAMNLVNRFVSLSRELLNLYSKRIIEGQESQDDLRQRAATEEEMRKIVRLLREMKGKAKEFGVALGLADWASLDLQGLTAVLDIAYEEERREDLLNTINELKQETTHLKGVLARLEERRSEGMVRDDEYGELKDLHERQLAEVEATLEAATSLLCQK